MGAGSIEALPEEVLLEVLSRVGSLKSLFMFAVTSRLWVRRFTDPAFLRGLCHGQEGHRARLLGFFLQKTWFHYGRSMVEARMKQHAKVAARRPHGPRPHLFRRRRQRLLQLRGASGRAPRHRADAARPRTSELMNDQTIRLLSICNPVTGERHLLPPLNSLDRIRTVCSYAIITAADLPTPSSSSGRFSFSQLLVTTQYANDKLHLHTYSAATRSWSAPTICLDRYGFSVVGERSAVVHQGAAHWLCVSNHPDDDDDGRLYKLSVEVDTTRASLTKLAGVRSRGKPVLSVAGFRLLCARDRLDSATSQRKRRSTCCGLASH